MVASKQSNTKMEIFKFGEHDVRTQLIDGEIWVVIADACKVLEIVNVGNVISRLDRDGVRQADVIDSIGRNHQVAVVNEPNLYRLIFRSDKPQAKIFQDWVYKDVLPAIRKTGSYSMDGISPKEHLANELGMLQFVHKVVHAVFTALSRKWIVANSQRARYAKVAFDYFRLEVIRADRAFTEVAKWHCGEDVFRDLNIKGDIAMMKTEIRNGEEIEVQFQFPFVEESRSA